MSPASDIILDSIESLNYYKKIHLLKTCSRQHQKMKSTGHGPCCSPQLIQGSPSHPGSLIIGVYQQALSRLFIVTCSSLEVS